MPMAPTGR